jgi:FAD/FMN-containing dehydrogenase
MSLVTSATTDITAAAPSLAGTLNGRIATPADSGWDHDRAAWNVAADQHPVLVGRPATATDVVTIVDFARRHGLRVAPQGTGHGAGALGDLADTILLRTDDLRDIRVDPDRRQVRVGAGATWGEVSRALTPFGLAALAGSSHDVGVTGYTLGGGYSWLARKHGLAANLVRAVELVTGDGSAHRIDAATDPDLFWAVRGSGGGTGIVTAIEFEVLPLVKIYAGLLFFPLDRAEAVLSQYAGWSSDLDEAATTCIRLLRLPPAPELPDFLRGRSFVAIDGAIDLPPNDAERLLAPLRALGPTMDTFATIPAAGLDQIHLDPPDPMPFVADGLVLNELTPPVVAALLAAAGPAADISLVNVELRQLGGAVGRRPADGGCVAHLPGAFLTMGVGFAGTPELHARAAADAAALRAALAPWAADRDYRNFRDANVPAAAFHSSADLARLRRIRDEHDPDRIIRANHPLD